MVPLVHSSRLYSSSSSLSFLSLVALSPLALAPVVRATKVLAGSAEVGARAAKVIRALLVDNGTAGFTSSSNARGLSRDGGLGHGVAFSEATLAVGTTVNALVLDVVLGTTVTS